MRNHTENIIQIHVSYMEESNSAEKEITINFNSFTSGSKIIEASLTSQFSEVRPISFIVLEKSSRQSFFWQIVKEEINLPFAKDLSDSADQIVPGDLLDKCRLDLSYF